jgi:predicted phage terminase large subunit-like protein
VLIVDDPLKNMEEADNFEIREKLEDWYFAAAYTRLAPGGGVLLIETMWHDDDLAGRLMNKMEFEPGADQFEVIRYPAISTEYEYRDNNTYEFHRSDIPLDLDAPEHRGECELIREPGEALHGDRYPLEYLQRIKANMAARIWSALYQQDPVPEEGLFFQQEWIHLSPTTPTYSNRRFFIAWDFAISQKQRADYTVGVCLMQDEYDNLYVVDLVRFKGDTYRITSEFIGMIQRWSQFEGSSIQLGVEDGQIWKSLKTTLRAQMREERAYVSIETMQALTDKESRARALQGRMEHKRFWFFEGSPWLQDAQRELLRFPAGRHDDIVDALSWAVRLATGKKPKKRPPKKKLKSWKDNLGQFIGASHSGGHMSA